MSDMKCPVCNVGYVHESVNHWCCDYEFCPSYDETDTETYDILIRTHNALEKAKKGLQELKDIIACPPDVSYETCVSMYADGALQEITALEQKEQQCRDIQ